MATTRITPTVLLLSALASTGCATMLNGRHQEVLVLSEPSGAAIRLNGKEAGATPATVRMRRRGPAVLEVGKTGFAPATVRVANTASRALYGNLIFLNPLAAQGMDSTSQWVGFAVGWFSGVMALDVWSGGALKRPPVVTVRLTPLAGATVEPAATAPAAPRTPPDYWPPAVRSDRRSRR